MKSFIGIGTAFSWFIFCVLAALVLLVAAVFYNGMLFLKKNASGKKLELPSFRFAR